MGGAHYEGWQFIGVTTVAGPGGRWTLALEVNGHPGVTAEAVAAVSAGTRIVAHRYNGGDGVGWFHRLQDGGVRLEF
ncbi:DUF6461 domain-containing protein [Actinomadura fulvescens]|uniref:DUF6461 domain-containing protein n=1 Tax=Actinomadura fulvescens TaxID=46160 RepID=UPI0031D4ED06